MPIRQFRLPLQPVRLLIMAACFCLSDTLSLAQTDAKDPLQIVPPPIPRYRRERPAFVITADPGSKPLPIPVPIRLPVPITPISAGKPEPPSAQILAGKEARRRETLRLEAETIRRNEFWLGIGKVLGFVLIVGVGALAGSDIARQVKKAKNAARQRAEDEENEWEP